MCHAKFAKYFRLSNILHKLVMTSSRMEDLASSRILLLHYDVFFFIWLSLCNSVLQAIHFASWEI